MKNCRTQTNKLIAIGTVALLALQVSTPAQAALIVTNGPLVFSGSASVTDTKATSGATLNNGASLGANILIPQFDATLGVLTGVTQQVTSTRNVIVAGNGTGGTGTSTATGSASATANLGAPGVSATFGTITVASQNANCSSYSPCTYSSSSASVVSNGSYGVAAGNLSAYVGSGTVSAIRTAPSLTVTSGGTKASTTATATENWNGSVTTSYSYLLHAAPSFNDILQTTLFSLDFGDVMLGSSVDPLLFRISNLADSNRAALDLDTISYSGDTSILTTDISSFTDLATGYSSDIFSAFVDTSVLGSFNANYLLTFSDADVGAEASRYKNLVMTLNLSGNVVPVPVLASFSVPEPSGLALFSAAILALAWRRREPILS
jgi:hypothetical protein